MPTKKDGDQTAVTASWLYASAVYIFVWSDSETFTCGPKWLWCFINLKAHVAHWPMTYGCLNQTSVNVCQGLLGLYLSASTAILLWLLSSKEHHLTLPSVHTKQSQSSLFLFVICWWWSELSEQGRPSLSSRISWRLLSSEITSSPHTSNTLIWLTHIYCTLALCLTEQSI